MSNTTITTLENIENLRARRTAALEESQKCGAALATAQSEADITGSDDGKTSPEDLHERGNQARKNLFEREAEASNAEEKLAEISEEFKAMLRNGQSETLALLQMKLLETKASLKQQLTPLICRGDSHAGAALDKFVLVCDEVRERQEALQFLVHLTEIRPVYHGDFSIYADALEKALRYN